MRKKIQTKPLMAAIIMLAVLIASLSLPNTGFAKDKLSCDFFPLAKKLTYQKYCARCHGETGDGEGRFAVLYRRIHAELPSDFTVGYFKTRPLDYLISIIEKGGKANQRGRFMPAYKDKLSDDEIKNLALVIQNIAGACNPATE